MKEQGNKLAEDVETLLVQSTVAEACDKVWAAFDEAMSALDPETRTILEQYFDGVGVETLSGRLGLSPSEMESWIAKAKRQLTRELGRRCTVRQ